MNILVTGANGFVGSALIERLRKEGHQVTALVRDLLRENPPRKNHVRWIEGDLLRPETLPPLESIDQAYYLVHGLKHENDVFEYQEAMLSVNFINWIRPTKAAIIYLGGLGREGQGMSPHLRSRHLTGAILGASGLPMTEFRASIVLGAGSLSFEMIKALAERIPFRPDFENIDQSAQPIALDDLLNYLVRALNLPPKHHRVVQIGGPDVTSYGELIELYAELAHLKRLKIKIPKVDNQVLLKVLDYAIPEYADVGKKLANSLEYETVLTDSSAKDLFPDIIPVGLREAMGSALKNSKSHYSQVWEKDFLKALLSDKILTQSGLLSPELLKHLERVGKLKDIFTRK